MEKKIATIISYVFHPLFIPTYVYLLLFSQSNFFTLSLTDYGQKVVLLLIFITTSLAPLAILLLLFKIKAIKEKLIMEKRQERILPLIICTVFYYANYYILANAQLHPIFQVLNIVLSLNIVVALIISFFIKISLHSIAWGAFIGVFLAISVLFQTPYFVGILGLVFIAGLVGSARLILKSHQTKEIYLGYLTGFVISLAALILYFR
jgi:hypothetical protein